MATLSSHANMYNTCLRILRHEGYRLWVQPRPDKNGAVMPRSLIWWAEKAGYEFSANNPIELLGLVSIYEHKRPTDYHRYWWQVEGPDIWDELYQEVSNGS